MTDGPPGEWKKALVVFGGEAAVWWLCLLKPGFRHCFVVLGNETGWIRVDPLSHRTLVSILPTAAEFDLAGHYRDAGYTVIETVLRNPPHRLAPLRPYSCVETVKRILGIQAPCVLTPWQLYNFFLAEEEMY